jgi:CheY-like chemotaxis protein
LSPPRRSRAQRSPDELDGHAVAPAAQRTRVVLIEDNPADVYLIQRELDRQGPEVEFVHYWDGDEALRHLLPGSGGTFVAPDLIFLDLRLPGIAGHEVLQILRGEPRIAGGADRDHLGGASGAAEPGRPRGLETSSSTSR